MRNGTGIQGLNLGLQLGMVYLGAWGLQLEGLGQKLKRGTGAGYGQGDFTQSRIRPFNSYSHTQNVDNLFLIIAHNV